MKELNDIKKLTEDFFNDIDTICSDYKQRKKALIEMTEEPELSCCNDELPDNGVCPTCKEHN